MFGAFAITPGAAKASTSGGSPAAYSANPANVRAGSAAAKKKPSNGNCSAGQILVSTLDPFSSLQCNAGTQLGRVLSGVPGDVAGSVVKSVAGDVMDQLTAWMVQAAQTISGWVLKQAAVITQPQLDASWYLNLFKGLAALGAALAGVVALIALGSAAIRRDPDALGEVVYGIGRAGIGTSVVVALTIIALSAADGIANDFARQMPADFFRTLASQWGGSGWGGFGAAALAFLVAFVATIAGLLVWLELIVREAAIYIAVLFFPVALAASIWPALKQWVRRLAMLLLMFVMLRPVVMIVLALAGSVTSAGLSFGTGSIPHSVTTILAGVVIFALAAFSPWALMFLLGTEVGVMYSRSAGSSSGSYAGPRDGGRVGGTLAGGRIGLPGGAELATAGAGADGAGAVGGQRGFQLASLGGSGANGGRATHGPIAAATGRVGEFAGAVGRVGGHVAQQAAARVQVAAGRPGVAPGGLLPPSAGGLAAIDDNNSGSASPEPSGGAPPSDAPSPVDSPAPLEPSSPADSSRPPAPPGNERPTTPLPPVAPPPPPADKSAGENDRNRADLPGPELPRGEDR